MQNKKKILWVEDDDSIAPILGGKLASAGFDLVRLKSGEEAIKRLPEERPDLVMVDILLPISKIDGFGVISFLRADQELKKLPVIVLSNLSAKSAMDQAKALNVNEFIIKPSVSLNEIMAKIESLLGR